MSEVQLTISDAQRNLLVRLLSRAVKEKRLEVHRTEFSRDYRHELEAEEGELESLLHMFIGRHGRVNGKLQQPGLHSPELLRQEARAHEKAPATMDNGAGSHYPAASRVAFHGANEYP